MNRYVIPPYTQPTTYPTRGGGYLPGPVMPEYYYPQPTRSLGGGWEPSPFDPRDWDMEYTRSAQPVLRPDSFGQGGAAPSPSLVNPAQLFLTRCALGLKSIAPDTDSRDTATRSSARMQAACYAYGAIGCCAALGLPIQPIAPTRSADNGDELSTRSACGDAGDAMEKFFDKHFGGTRGEGWGRDFGELADKIGKCVRSL